MGTRGYWDQVTSRRIARRRLLRSAAGLSTAAAALAVLSCGSDDSGSTQDQGSNLVAKPEDTTAKATKGGILDLRKGDDPPAFDFVSPSASPDYSGHAYSRLIKYEAIKHPKPALANVVADAAISWETSPDGLQYTYKLRPNMKFDSRPPTNGRAMTAEDVIFSWNRFATKSTFRSTLINSVDPEAPVVSMTSPDASTVVVKLAFPYAPLPVMLGYYRYGQIMPVEVDAKFDPRQDIRGTGPWRLKAFAPSLAIEYEKNPDWYDAARVNLEGIRYNTLPEYAAALSQFSAGRLATYEVNAADVLATKRRQPQLTMLANEEFPVGVPWIRFSYLPNSPFLDERVRKAASMQLDRDLYIKTFGNVDEFERAGIAVPMRWNSAIANGEDEYWLDPSDEKTLGAGARFYKHDPAEAKKMLQAAGFNSALEQKFTYGANTTLAGRQAEVLKAMWEEGGLFKLNGSNLDFNSEFRPKYSQGSNKHEGIAYSGASGYPDIDGWLTVYYKSGSERSGHLDANGKPDAELDGMIKKQRGELDPQKRVTVIHDLQKYAASKMYMLNDPGTAAGFLLAWPWLRNFGMFRAKAGSLPAIEGWTHYWIDSSLKSTS